MLIGRRIAGVIGIGFIVAGSWMTEDVRGECPKLSYNFSYTVGSLGSDNTYSVREMASGAALLVGDFEDSVDFDPTKLEDIHDSNGGCDVFVTLIHPDGSYGWTRTVGGIQGDTAQGVAEGSDRSIFIAGIFYGSVDFDPSEGVDIHIAIGEHDAFLMKLSATGDYEWTATYGSPDEQDSPKVSVDGEGDIYVTGDFNGTTDFDPSEGGEDFRTSNGSQDVFLTKVTPHGDEVWTLTLGGIWDDWPHSIEVFEEVIYIAGDFSDTVDFDPGPGVDEHTSNGQRDAFVSKFTTDGEYLWTWTAGGEGTDQADGVSASAEGDVFVTGAFSTGPVDFDPGEGVDEFVSNGSYDAFVSKLGADGSYQWTHAFGGTYSDFGKAVSAGSEDNVFVAGWFGNSLAPAGYPVDFNPGSGDVHLGNGEMDYFLMALGADGSYQWTQTGGGTSTDRAWTIDASGQNILIGGSFSTSFDFDPTSGEEIHTSNGFTDAFLTSLACTDEPPVCEGDTNGDSVVDPLDSGYVLSRLNCPVGQGDPLCDAADANRDGLVDPLDVGYVLSRFGECP